MSIDLRDAYWHIQMKKLIGLGWDLDIRTKNFNIDPYR